MTEQVQINQQKPVLERWWWKVGYSWVEVVNEDFLEEESFEGREGHGFAKKDEEDFPSNNVWAIVKKL